MNALVAITPAGARTNSRLVADVFEKQHKDVLRAIDTILDRKPELRGRNFAPTQEEVGSGGAPTRSVRFFEMDRDGFCLVAMGFTGEKALEWKLAFIEAFNALEHHVIDVVEEERQGSALIGIDIDAMSERMRMVRETRLLYGRQAAKRLWEDLGLPDVSPRGRPPSFPGGILEESVAEWMDQCTEIVRGHKVESSTLFQHYVWWCGQMERRHVSLTMFGRQLTCAGIFAQKSGRVQRIGLKIKD